MNGRAQVQRKKTEVEECGDIQYPGLAAAERPASSALVGAQPAETQGLDAEARATTGSRFRHDFSQVRVHADNHLPSAQAPWLPMPAPQIGLTTPLPAPVIQAQLTVSAPADRYEQEADQVANMVMRSSATATDDDSIPQATPARDQIQTPRISGGTAGFSDVPPQVENSVRDLKGDGQPLPKSERAFFEPRFGHDFSGVRVHADSRAADLSRNLSARAFTVGQDIAFDAGAYAPGTDAGRRLIAHELTHVVQQQGTTHVAQTKPQEKPNYLKVAEGQLTFEVEGNEGGPYHSRTIHWPGGISGVTIGRGYDLGQHTERQIIADMVKAGISQSDAQKFASAAGIKGKAAKAFVSKHKSSMPTITLEQQQNLFSISYRDLARDVERISNKKDTQTKYGKVDWEHLNPIIRDLIVDLRFRGDYTPTTRKIIQPCVVKNDLQKLYEVISDKKNWANVPPDRFERRVRYIEQALSHNSGKPSTTQPASAPVKRTRSPIPEKRMNGQQVSTNTQFLQSVRQFGVHAAAEIEALSENVGDWLHETFQGTQSYFNPAYAAPHKRPEIPKERPKIPPLLHPAQPQKHSPRETITQPEAPMQQANQTFPRLGPVLKPEQWVSQFSDANPEKSRLTSKERNGTKDKVACNKACMAMLHRAGFKPFGYYSEKTTFQTLRENKIKKENEVTKEAGEGIEYLDKELAAGRPVIVGVDHGIKSNANEGITDHFVVIVEKNIDPSNGKIYYRFFDPGTRYYNRGTSPQNRLSLEPDYRATGNGVMKDKYHLSQVRRNEVEKSNH